MFTCTLTCSQLILVSLKTANHLALFVSEPISHCIATSVSVSRTLYHQSTIQYLMNIPSPEHGRCCFCVMKSQDIRFRDSPSLSAFRGTTLSFLSKTFQRHPWAPMNSCPNRKLPGSPLQIFLRAPRDLRHFPPACSMILLSCCLVSALV